MRQRIHDSFALNPDNGTREFEQAQNFLEALRSNMSDVATKLRQAGIFMLLLIVVFILITAGAWSRFTFIGIELDSISLLHQILPATIAYGFFEVILLQMRKVELTQAHSLIMARLYPALEKYDLEELLIPHLPVFLAGRKYTLSNADSGSTRVADLGTAITSVLALLTPIGLEVYAHISLFSLYGTSAVNFASLGVSVFFILIAAGTVVSD